MQIPALQKLLSGKPPNLGKNILWLIISRFGTQGLMVLFTLVLARRLGSAAFGAYAFFATVIFISNAITTFGTDMLLIREIANQADLSLLLPALLIQLVLSAVLIAVIWAAAPLIPNQTPDSVLALQIYSLALLPLAFFSIFTTLLRGRQRMQTYMLLNLLVSAMQLAVVWAFVRPGGSIVWLAGLLLLVQCAGAVAGGLFVASQIPRFWMGWHFSWHKTIALVYSSAPIALIALIGILYQKISIYMLATLLGPQPTGWFSAALRVIEAAKTIHLAVFTALYPAMAQVGGTPWKKPWQGPFKSSWQILLVGAVAASLLIFIFAGTLIMILYGPEYIQAAAGLRLLSLILIPFTINTFFSLAILANHKEQSVMRVQSVGLVTLIGLNVWWIPLWGVTGACLAFVFAETLQALLYLSPIQIIPKTNPPWRDSDLRSPFKNQAKTGDQAQPGDSV